MLGDVVTFSFLLVCNIVLFVKEIFRLRFPSVDVVGSVLVLNCVAFGFMIIQLVGK